MQDWQTIPNVRNKLSRFQDKGRLKLNFFLSIIFMGMILNGYDATLISGLQAFNSWHEDLGNPSGALIGLLNAAGPISGFVVGPIVAWIDETLGRRWGIRFYGYTIVIGTAISCGAGAVGVKGYALFLVGRLIIGMGQASFLMTSLVLVQEITHPHSREVVAGSWNSWWILGSVLVAWVNLGTSYIVNSWGWRIPYLIQLPLAVYLLIAVQFAPESPRWLISKGREEEGFQFLVDYHGNGDRDDPLVMFEFSEIKEAICRERAAKAETWSSILKSPPNRYRLGLAALMTFLTNLSGSSIIYFYYSIVFDSVGITDPTAQTGLSAGLSIATWISEIVAILVGKRVGRRKIVLWVWPVLLLCLVGLVVSGWSFDRSGSSSSAKATVALVWVFLIVYNFSNPVLYSYPAEVQTFSMRTKGLLVWNTVTQLQTAYVTFVDAVALTAIGWKYYFVYMPLVIIQFGLAWRYMVETKGYTLEEIAVLFDGSSASLTDMLPQVEQLGVHEHDDEK